MNLINEKNQIKIGQLFVLGSILGVITSPPLANIFIALTLIWTLSFQVTRSNLASFFSSKTGYFFLTFLAIILASPLYGIAPQSEIISSIWGWRKILMFPLAAIYFSNRPAEKSLLIQIFFICCLTLAIVSFLKIILVGGDGILIRNYVTQGLVLSVASLIGLLKLVESSSTKWKLIYFSSLAILVSNIALISTGRSGYAALLVMLSLSLALHPKISATKKFFSIALIIALICTIFFSIPNSKNRIKLAYTEAVATKNQAQDTSVGVRIIFWKNTLNMARNSSILGVGTGGFETAYRAEVRDKSGIEALITGDPHNQYLKILIEQGILGLFIFLSLLTFLVISNPKKDIFNIIGVCTLIAWSITSLANAHFSTFNEGQFIWIWMGIFLTSQSTLVKTDANKLSTAS